MRQGSWQKKIKKLINYFKFRTCPICKQFLKGESVPTGKVFICNKDYTVIFIGDASCVYSIYTDEYTIEYDAINNIYYLLDDNFSLIEEKKNASLKNVVALIHKLNKLTIFI